MDTDRIISADVIRAKEIIVGDAVIKTNKEGTGIWLTDRETGACICICSGYDQGVQVSVRSGNQQGPHDISIQAARDKANLQLVETADHCRLISVKELLDILSR